MQAARDPLALVVELQGDSMQPLLPRGCRLRVEPVRAAGDLAPGEIVVLRGPTGLVVHRLVWISGTSGHERLVHRGDAGGRAGLALGSALVGRVQAVLTPPGPVPALAALNPGARRAFRRAQKRARVFLVLSAGNRRLGGLPARLATGAGWLRERLLG